MRSWLWSSMTWGTWNAEVYMKWELSLIKKKASQRTEELFGRRFWGKNEMGWASLKPNPKTLAQSLLHGYLFKTELRPERKCTYASLEKHLMSSLGTLCLVLSNVGLTPEFLASYAKVLVFSNTIAIFD